MAWEELAAEQFGLISRAQATNSGLTAKQIERLVLSGTWERSLPSVYRRTDVARAWPSPLQAALLWAGDGAVISHESAAALWGFNDMSKSVVQISGQRMLRPPPGVQYTRVIRLEEPDKTFCQGLPVTTVPRTLLDASGTFSERQFERTFDEALWWNLTCIQHCEWMLERHPAQGRPGAALMKLLLENRKRYGLLRSPLESDFEGRRRAWGLPEALHNEDLFIRNLRIANVDFLWPEHKVIVETHGKVHMKEKTWMKDLDVLNELQGTGWQLFSVTTKMLENEPEKIRTKLTHALAPSLFSRQTLHP